MAAASARLLQYDANGVPQIGTGAKWYQGNFNDAAWQTGPGPFGYGTLTNNPTPIATKLATSVQYLTPTTYLRRTFTVIDVDQARTDPLQLTVEYNDGFVAYLNGVEVARRNGGPVNKFIYHDQPAYNREVFAGTQPIPTNTTTESIPLGTAVSKLVVGDNILAIQALNADPFNTNFYLNAGLQIVASPAVNLVNCNDAWRYFPVRRTIREISTIQRAARLGQTGRTMGRSPTLTTPRGQRPRSHRLRHAARRGCPGHESGRARSSA